MALKIDHGKCTGCSACIQVCPVDALSIKENKAIVDEETCLECGACIGECPTGAIEFD